MKIGRAYRAIHEHAEIEFALDVQAFFDQQAADDAAFFAGLRRDEGHAHDLAGEIGGFVGRFREFYAAAFAAASRVNLRFHDYDLGAQAFGYCAGFVFFVHYFAARDRNAKFRKDGFGLVFVDLHAGSIGFLKVAFNNSVKICGRIKRPSLLGRRNTGKERHGTGNEGVL